MIIFDSNETKFEGNGLGTIPEATDAQAVEELNGGDEISFKIPITAKHFHDLKPMRYILCTPSYGRNPQAYRIYKISKPINGICTVNGEHISYRLNKTPLMPFSASNASDAMAGIETHSFESPFHFHTELGTQAAYKQTSPSTVRKQLGGVEGSILDVYGGQYDWDMFDVYLRKRRGTDKGITIEYGKNLTDLTQEESIEATYTGICPYWAGTVNNEPVSVYLSEKVLLADNADKFPYNSIEVVDLTSKITLPEGTDKPTEDMVRQAAKSYMKSRSYGVPKVSLTVSFVDLAQTMEYEDFQNFEKVQLGDTVTVRFDSLGVDATAKINKVTYDIINQRYIKIELGDSRTDLSSTIASQQKELNDVGSTTAGLSTAVASQQKQLDNVGNVTDERINEQIKSLKNLEGHAFLHYNSNGRPYEFIVSDSENLSVAKKVWRWNENGLAYSSTGYNGDYSSAAITSDGKINAEFIKAGILQGVAIISDDPASNEHIDIVDGTLTTYDRNGWEGLEITGQKMNINSWKTEGKTIGGIGAFESDAERGIAIGARDGCYAGLGHVVHNYDGADTVYSNFYASDDGNLNIRATKRQNDGSISGNYIMWATSDEIGEGHTPHFPNTGSGTLRLLDPNGVSTIVIEVEHGLIKSWHAV